MIMVYSVLVPVKEQQVQNTPGTMLRQKALENTCNKLNNNGGKQSEILRSPEGLVQYLDFLGRTDCNRNIVVEIEKRWMGLGDVQKIKLTKPEPFINPETPCTYKFREQWTVKRKEFLQIHSEVFVDEIIVCEQGFASKLSEWSTVDGECREKLSIIGDYWSWVIGFKI